MDLVVEGRLFLEGRLQQGSVGIDDGRIVAVKKVLRGEKRIDVGSRIVLPAAMDPHVHFREPGLTWKENFSSGSLAALYGGVTTVLDMPNTVPPTDRLPFLLDKKRMVCGRSFVDYGLFVTTSSIRRLETMAPYAVGLKIFMGSTTAALLENDDQNIYRLLRSAEALGLPVSVHAEDDNLIRKEEASDLKGHLRNRPAEAEINAVRRLASLGAKGVNVCHVSHPDTLSITADNGMVTEAAPHHLLLDTDTALGARAKVNPPLREPSCRQALFYAMASGRIDMMGSDHAPHLAEEKAEEFEYSPSGVPGVETMFPLMMAAVKRRELPLDILVSMCCERPAQRFGVSKGRIAEGFMADLAIYDPRQVTEIQGRRLHSLCGWTPYEGIEAIFPRMVIMRGEIQLKEGELCGEAIGSDIRNE
ncbi:MAG: dihydroorotase [Candidatus Methanomethylophilaceae archaeon]|nr:dihydroorotase [Candidatus Methanomethylophilaceae archaeon]